MRIMDSESGLPSVRELAAVLALESVRGFGPQKFKTFWEAGLTAADLLGNPLLLPIPGRIGAGLRDGIQALSADDLAVFHKRAAGQIEAARKAGGHILLHGNPHYPPLLWRSNSPVPVLHVLGDLSLLASQQAVACVGSRAIVGRYEAAERSFAMVAVRNGWTVVSGFATGADSVGHQGAYEAGGPTIAVMPCGLDRPFPPENKELWRTFLEYPKAAMVSEFAWGTAAARLTLQKRNKTIVALSRGVFVAQSSAKGGAMNAFRFGVEQKKQIATFEDDGTDATSGNREVAAHPLGRALPLEQTDEGEWLRWLGRL
jgi:DNA protecting protein DprA